MPDHALVVFVCEHGAAKSVVAAAQFNRLAATRGLAHRAVARGTHPDPELSPGAVQGLAAEGLAPGESKPRQLTLQDVGSARHVIAFCDLPEEYGRSFELEKWESIPPVSEGYVQSRAAILGRMEQLIDVISRNASGSEEDIANV